MSTDATISSGLIGAGNWPKRRYRNRSASSSLIGEMALGSGESMQFPLDDARLPALFSGRCRDIHRFGSSKRLNQSEPSTVSAVEFLPQHGDSDRSGLLDESDPGSGDSQSARFWCAMGLRNGDLVRR